MKKYILFILSFISIDFTGQDIPPELVPDFIDYETCLVDTVSNNSSQQVISEGCRPVYDSRSYDSKFIPLPVQPIIYIRTNFIFLQREDGTGNFQENNTEHQLIIDEIITKMNNLYSNMYNPNNSSCYTGTDFVQDARIQFLVNKVYIKDNYGWNNRHDPQSIKCPEAYPNWYLDYLDQQIVNDPMIPRGINIYFTEDSINYRNLVELQDSTRFHGATYACSQFPSPTNYTKSSKIHMPDVYSKYWYMKNIIPGVYNQPWDPVVKSWETNGLGSGLAHEIGHSLWLFHSSPYYVSGGCYYSIMNPAGASPRNYLPPTEVGRIFASLSLTNLRSFVPNDAYIGIKQISSQETWNNMRLFHSLNITSSGNMIFNCDITMPYQSYIEVNGEMSINNSNIHSIQNNWNGIVVKQGGLLVLNSTEISDYNIVVESGGTLLIKNSLIISNNCNIAIQSGGYFCIESTTNIQLTHYNSLIKISEGAINGINPNLSITSDCGANLSNLAITGEGSIIDYSQDLYLQNTAINTNRFYGGKNVYVGNHVNQNQTFGDVKIDIGTNVIIDAKTLTLDTGFECSLGGIFEVISH